MAGWLTKLTCVWSIALLSTLPSVALAQCLNHMHAPIQTEDQTNPDNLPPPHVMKGIGNSVLFITANAEAQRWFNQGLNLLHDFWDYESARAFEQSIRADHDCAMCYWGLYQALTFFHGNNKGYAPAALLKAEELAGRATERERLYIRAAQAEESGFDAKSIWLQIVQEYPKDTQAPLFLASLSNRQDSLEILHAVLQRSPNDSAANHYLIHKLEATKDANEALRSASILSRLAPRSGHMVHMPGHIYFVLGEYERAEKPFAASLHVDERYMRHEHVEPDDDWNYVHNIMYSIANYMEEGKLQNAADLSSRKLPGARGTLESTLYTYQPRDSISRVHPQLPVALRTVDWTKTLALLAEQPVPNAWPNLQFLAQQLRFFAEAMQAYKQHNLTEANRLRTDFDKQLSKAKQDEKPTQHAIVPARREQNDDPRISPPQRTRSADALLPSLLGTLEVMSLELKGWANAETDHLEVAASVFDEAAAQQAALGYREPPAYIRPVRESEGQAFFEGKHWEEAFAAYAAALKERPHSGWALYGMARCSEQQMNTAQTRQEYTDFLVAWKHADKGLPQLEHAHWFLAHTGKTDS